jgi:hypothetical protein
MSYKRRQQCGWHGHHGAGERTDKRIEQRRKDYPQIAQMTQISLQGKKNLVEFFSA